MIGGHRFDFLWQYNPARRETRRCEGGVIEHGETFELGQRLNGDGAPDLWFGWWRVAHTMHGDVTVSTAFLGLDAIGNGAFVFETMIFGGEHDGERWRCGTVDEAEQQHEHACELAFAETAKES